MTERLILLAESPREPGAAEIQLSFADQEQRGQDPLRRVLAGFVLDWALERPQALAVGTGLQALTATMEAEVTAAYGPQGRRDPARTPIRQATRPAR
jgi:hypothetical protein